MATKPIVTHHRGERVVRDIQLDAETPADTVRNALVILQCAGIDNLLAEDTPLRHYRASDLDEVRRLLRSAMDAIDQGHGVDAQQLRRNMERALGEVRLLRGATAAPKPMWITRVLSPSRANPDASEETLIVTLTDGAMRRYWPNAPVGEGWEDLEPVPGTRSAILAAAVAS